MLTLTSIKEILGINYNQYIQNKIKNKLCMKAIIMHASNWNKKPQEVLKTKAILSTL